VRRLVLALHLLALLCSISIIAKRIGFVEAPAGTIYIRPDGAIDPQTSLISSTDNVTYAFTDNINGSIVVQRSNIAVDGNGHTLQGSGFGKGFDILDMQNVLIRNTTIKGFESGINFNSTSNNTLSENSIIANSLYNIYLYKSSNNSICKNNLTASYYAIMLTESDGNIVIGNNIRDNYNGIGIHQSASNEFFHNNLANNTFQVHFTPSILADFWDDGFEGNYWNDYQGLDLNQDGLGDSAYAVTPPLTTPPELMQYDNHPLMGRFRSFNVSWVDSGHIVDLISNSTISAFDVGVWIEHPENTSERIIRFDVTGETGSGFCRMCIPTALLSPSYRVYINGSEFSYTLLPCSNSTHNYIYFTYNHSTQEVIVVSELLSFPILLLFTMTTLLAIIVCARRRLGFQRVRKVDDHA
jgi:parallel beta-helix repeat protein